MTQDNRKAILDTIDAHRDDAIEFLRKMISIP